MLAFYLASWAAQVALNLLSSVLSSRLNPAATAELASKKGIWRPLTDPLALYPLLGAPLVNAIALHQLHAALRLPSVAGGGWRGGCGLALALWAAGPLHGLVINFSSLKTSALLTAHFATTTLVLALANGALFALMS